MAQAGRPLASHLLAERLEALQRDGGVALMAVEWGPPSGVIVLHWYQPLTGARAGLVSLLLVAPDAWRRGIARLLLKAGSQAARVAGCDALRLAVPPDATDLAGSERTARAGAVRCASGAESGLAGRGCSRQAASGRQRLPLTVAAGV